MKITDGYPNEIGNRASRLQGVYSDQISFSSPKHSQSGFQLDMFIASNEKISVLYPYSGKNVAEESIMNEIYYVRLDNQVLKLSENQIPYRNQPAAFQSEHRFYNKGGKLHYEYDGTCFDMDTKTMQRNDSSEDSSVKKGNQTP